MRKIIVPLLIITLIAIIMGISIENRFTDSKPTLINDTTSSNSLVEKINTIDINTFTHEKIIGVLGTPEKYIWKNYEFTVDTLPSSYIMVYSKAFHIFMMDQSIVELRFYDDFYTTDSGVQVGSTLEEVLAILGEPSITVTSKPVTFETNVLFKDIDGRSGYCYYFLPDQNIRFFCTDYVLNSLYITRDYIDQNPNHIFTPASENYTYNAPIVDATFIEDKQLHGKWRTIGSTFTIEDFDPNNLRNEYGFIVETLEIKSGGSLNFEHLKWTKDLIYHVDSYINYGYTIKDIDKSTYLFLLPSGGEYALSYKAPMYVVMERVSE